MSEYAPFVKPIAFLAKNKKIHRIPKKFVNRTLRESPVRDRFAKDQNFVGFHGEVGTPGSIPNPEVKHLIADDTAFLSVGT